MNAISIDRQFKSDPATTAARLITGTKMHATPSDLRVEWLPTSMPAARRPKLATPLPGNNSRILWVYRPGDTALEKVLLGLLVAAAVIGIGYGFSCFVDLVQNWAAVNAGIRNLI